jgi:hypothetical protein
LEFKLYENGSLRYTSVQENLPLSQRRFKIADVEDFVVVDKLKQVKPLLEIKHDSFTIKSGAVNYKINFDPF